MKFAVEPWCPSRFDHSEMLGHSQSQLLGHSQSKSQVLNKRPKSAQGGHKSAPRKQPQRRASANGGAAEGATLGRPQSAGTLSGGFNRSAHSVQLGRKSAASTQQDPFFDEDSG